jgi:hypothetical protein
MLKKPKGVILLGLGLLAAFVVVASTLVALTLLLSSPIQTTVFPRPTPVSPRTISQEATNQLSWHQGSICIRQFSRPSAGLVVGHEYVAFVTSTEASGSVSNRLKVLDARTGTTLWQSEPFDYYETFAIGRDRAFVLRHEGSPLDIYDINGSNSPIVSFSHFKEATSFYIFPQVVEQDVRVYYYNRAENRYVLHKVSLGGQIIANPRQMQGAGYSCCLFLFEEPFALLSGEEFIGLDFETGQELWHVPASGRIDSWPVLRNDALIISSGNGKDYAIIALDRQNGRGLWRTDEEFGSNVVQHQGSLYALRNDAVLVRIAPTTGQVETEFPFYPASIDGGAQDYWLASDEERLFVYFGDSRELFAFVLSK